MHGHESRILNEYSENDAVDTSEILRSRLSLLCVSFSDVQGECFLAFLHACCRKFGRGGFSAIAVMHSDAYIWGFKDGSSRNQSLIVIPAYSIVPTTQQYPQHTAINV